MPCRFGLIAFAGRRQPVMRFEFLRIGDRGLGRRSMPKHSRG